MEVGWEGREGREGKEGGEGREGREGGRGGKGGRVLQFHKVHMHYNLSSTSAQTYPQGATSHATRRQCGLGTG